MLKLPNYEVVIHIHVSEFSTSLEDKIEAISKALYLDESSEFKGVRDYHWAFETWDAAITAGEKFKHLIENPNLLMLRVKANYDSTIQPISHKDLVRPREKI